jgi:hypothetical protein
MPYIGSSAGANIAGPRILTTNDWNVVALDAFDALGLVPFNINPHYLETDPTMAPGSETRDDRISEYHVVWDNAVVGIEEGTLVRVEDGAVTVQGRGRVKLFARGKTPRWFTDGERARSSAASKASRCSILPHRLQHLHRAIARLDPRPLLAVVEAALPLPECLGDLEAEAHGLLEAQNSRGRARSRRACCPAW